MPYPEDGETVWDCDTDRLRISIEERDGVLYYRARHEGTAAATLDHSEHLVQIEQARDESGQYLPAIYVKYPGETRRDDKRELQSWRLVMTDKDSFKWSATQWNFEHFGAARTRCEGEALVS